MNSVLVSLADGVSNSTLEDLNDLGMSVGNYWDLIAEQNYVY